MKKSVVATIACSSFKRYTAASSAVSLPTSKSVKNGNGTLLFNRSARTPGAILQPQPPPWDRLVSRGDGVEVSKMSVIRGYPAKWRVTDIMVVVATGRGETRFYLRSG